MITIVGANTLVVATTGTQNVAVGAGAMNQSTATTNTAVGANALFNDTNGESVAVGWQPLKTHTNGFGNTAVGYGALTKLLLIQMIQQLEV